MEEGRKLILALLLEVRRLIFVRSSFLKASMRLGKYRYTIDTTRIEWPLSRQSRCVRSSLDSRWSGWNFIFYGFAWPLPTVNSEFNSSNYAFGCTFMLARLGIASGQISLARNTMLLCCFPDQIIHSFDEFLFHEPSSAWSLCRYHGYWLKTWRFLPVLDVLFFTFVIVGRPWNTEIFMTGSFHVDTVCTELWVNVTEIVKYSFIFWELLDILEILVR